MKVNPSLFPQSAAPTRPNTEVSEARRAFEAMLSASSSRTRMASPAATSQDSATIAQVKQASPKATEDASPQTRFSRPGRVLDIRV